jgi:nucleotide-binding universal stress UspA family protein
MEAGVQLLGDSRDYEIVVVASLPDPADLHGVSGHAGSTMTQAEFDQAEEEALRLTEAMLANKAERLGLATVPRIVLDGEPGPAICKYADEVSAGAIVVGSRGRSGLKRAVLGSVSDHIARSAGCPVVVVPPSGD